MATGRHDVDDLQRALGEFARDIVDGVKDADRETGSQAAEDAVSGANSIGGVASHVAPSISDSDGEVRFGGPAWPMAMGAEFGRDRYKQFDPWTGSGDTAGYFLIPAIKRHEDDPAEYEDLASDATKEFL